MSKKIHFSILVIFIGNLIPVFAQDIFTVESLAPAPEAVSNNAVCGTTLNGGEYIYSFSGIDTLKTHNGIHLKSFKYSVNTDSWTQLPDLPDGMGKIAAGASIVGGVAYVIGGYHVFSDGSEQSSEKIHRLDLNTDTFLPDGAAIPVPIDDHVQDVYNDSLIYVITGWSQNTNVPNVQIYDTYNDTWLVGTSVPNLPAYKSFGASGAILGNTIYYFGGARIGGSFPIQNELRIGKINPADPTQITWSVHTPDPNIVGYRMAPGTIDNKLVWIGGSEQTYNYNGIAYAGNVPVEPSNRILLLDTATLTFSEGNIVNSTSNIPMDLRGAYKSGNSFYLLGGMLSNQEVTGQTTQISYSYTSINDIYNNDELIVYPNPIAKGQQLNINTRTFENVEIKLFDIQGKVVQLEITNNQISLPSSISPGMYWLEVSDHEHSTTNKIIVTP